MYLPIPPLKVSLSHVLNRRPKEWSPTPMADRSFYSGHSVMSDFSEKEKRPHDCCRSEQVRCVHR